MKNTTKKQQYISCLEHDIAWFEKELQIVREGKRVKLQIFIWHHGDRIPRYQVREMVKELKQELSLVLTDKTYKPWK